MQHSARVTLLQACWLHKVKVIRAASLDWAINTSNDEEHEGGQALDLQRKGGQQGSCPTQGLTLKTDRALLKSFRGLR